MLSWSSSRDNWERLVAAVVKRQQIWELCHQQSFSTISSDDDDLSQLTLSFSGSNFEYFSVPPSPLLPSTNPSISQEDVAIHESREEAKLKLFQMQVAYRFQVLAAAPSNELLSIPWIRKLLDTFLCCEEEFRAIIFNYRNRPPMNRYISDLCWKSVKALDVCNAIRDGIEQIRLWQKHLEIILCALDNQWGIIREGQIRRAKKALLNLATAIIDKNDDSNTNILCMHTSFSPLSWRVSRSWSAARQIQAIGSNLVAPNAIPCQDRGLQTQLYLSVPFHNLHERIMEESMKQDRRNTTGLLNEIHDIEKCCRHMNEITDSLEFPITQEREKELKERVEEVRVLYQAINTELDPLERLVKQVFRRIVQSVNNIGAKNLDLLQEMDFDGKVAKFVKQEGKEVNEWDGFFL